MKFWEKVKSWFVEDEKLIDSFRETIATEEVKVEEPKKAQIRIESTKKTRKPRAKKVTEATPTVTKKTTRKPRAKKAK